MWEKNKCLRERLCVDGEMMGDGMDDDVSVGFV